MEVIVLRHVLMQILSFKLPDNFKLDEAAAFPVAYITAYMMMFDLGNLQDGDTFSFMVLEVE